jgi:hypothetical protein
MLAPIGGGYKLQILNCKGLQFVVQHVAVFESLSAALLHHVR